MDDLYQNAWSDPAETGSASLKSDAVSWSPTKVTSTYGEEADLSMPSWSTGVGVTWDEPSHSPGLSWSQADHDAGWGSSTYEGIAIGKSSLSAEVPAEIDSLSEGDPREPKDDAEPVEEEEPTASRTPSPTFQPLPSSPPPNISSPPLPEPFAESLPHLDPESTPVHSYDRKVIPIPVDVIPATEDAFGGFESGLTTGDSPSPGFAATTEDSDPWGSAWADSRDAEEEIEEPVDEWERAVREKAKQDRIVPPELLAKLVRESEEFAKEVFSEPKVDEKSSEKDAWLNDRRSGLEGVPGLTALSESYRPALELRPSAKFSQTLVAKRMASSVKLTKNLPITRRSPMSHYLLAKGSVAWEVSVKERKEVVEDDVPVGWRIVEKAPVISTDATKDKKSSGLFSFWNRRQTPTPVNANTTAASAGSRSSSIDKPRSPVVAELKAESTRPSQDSARPSAAGSRTSPTSEAPQPTLPAPTAPPPTTSYTTASDPLALPGETQAPSAVSRFLNRFSRRSSLGGNPRSMALSSDDLEFLSDIPSASDDVDEDTSADALEQFFNARAPAIPVLPPPLAPPPLVPPLRPASTASLPSTLAAKSISPTAAINDLDILFGAATVEPAIAQPNIPTLAPPISPSRPMTPSNGLAPRPSSVASGSALPNPRPASRAQSPPVSVPSGFALPPPPSFQPIISSATVIKVAKPKLPSPLPLNTISTEPGPMSASSTSSTSYETAGEVSPSSPTSALPLGQLYPHLVQQAPSPLPPGSSQALMPDGDKPATFGLETPLASKFSSGPHTPSRRPLAQPNTNLFDDDDFSDFQSPVDASKPSPAAPPPIAKSPPARANRLVHGASSFGLPPPPAPSVGSKDSLNNRAAFGLDDDDFADFQDSPMSTSVTNTSTNSSLFTNSASDTMLLTPTNASSTFSGFDDFFGSSVTKSDPPRVPLKPSASLYANMQPPPLQPPPPPPPPGPPSSSSAPHLPPPLPGPRLAAPAKRSPPPSSTSSSSSMPSISSASSSSSLLARRKSHAAEHLHTLDLMNRAAASSGKRWPAPASPLPAAIPGPAGGLRGPGKAPWNFLEEEEEEGTRPRHPRRRLRRHSHPRCCLPHPCRTEHPSGWAVQARASVAEESTQH
ncbi:uncharacterized protein BXZ73DRAFT_100376 [Epithele typhae]|uniref:uncharacterized protein n=1 Tax=Epithele typhae TaxID=378194 RepID=UPI00200886C2|nr:uncharacterized protein BXZ73DRAFT_100376 [Epithele typhae]KAH9935907.1 hypothetical protein BXZ73DRAFT_100376 [Epithele typhae]